MIPSGMNYAGRASSISRNRLVLPTAKNLPSGRLDFAGLAVLKLVTNFRRPLRGLCLALMLAGFGCTPTFIGPTTPSGYRFAVLSPVTVMAGESDDIVVRVQDAQGQKVDGVLVSFQVAPALAGNASVTPTRTMTRGGQARTTFRAGIIGPVPVWVQVENTRHELTIVIDVRGDPPDGT